MDEHRDEVSQHSGRIGELSVRWLGFVAFALVLSAVLPSIALRASGVGGQYIAGNTPGFVSSAANVGAVDVSQTIEISIWLQPHNRGALDALARDLYDPSSPKYRRWLKSSEIAAQFAPTAAEAKTIEQFVSENRLKVIGVGPNNFYVRAQGTIANVESAFRVKLNNYQVGGKILRANAGDPYIDGPAASLVQAVSGLDNTSFEHPAVLQSAGLPPTATSESAGAGLAQRAHLESS